MDRVGRQEQAQELFPILARSLQVVSRGPSELLDPLVALGSIPWWRWGCLPELPACLPTRRKRM